VIWIDSIVAPLEDGNLKTNGLPSKQRLDRY